MKNLTATQIKENARETLLNELLQKFEGGQIAATEIALKAGEENGKPIYIKVKLTTTDFEDRKTTKKEFKAFNLQAEMEKFENEKAEKLQKAKEKKRETAQKKIEKLQKQLENEE